MIKNNITNNNYNNTQNIIKQTINKNYTNDQTYYLNNIIITTINSKSKNITK